MTFPHGRANVSIVHSPILRFCEAVVKDGVGILYIHVENNKMSR